MKGCHNCKYSNHNWSSYEDSPCSKCDARKDPPPSGALQFERIEYSETYATMPDFDDEPDFRKDLIAALGRCVTKLIDLHRNYPETFKFAYTKITKPHLSYADIARIHNCRKQNVQYHLRKAVAYCEDLKHAFLVDQRFNPKTI